MKFITTKCEKQSLQKILFLTIFFDKKILLYFIFLYFMNILMAHPSQRICQTKGDNVIEQHTCGIENLNLEI